MWGKIGNDNHISYITDLMNQKRILVNLGDIVTQIEHDLKQGPFGVTFSGLVGLNPLGGWRATADKNVSWYNMLKFIVQFTNDQTIYQQCLKILRSIKFPTPMLRTPEEVLYLAQYNPYCGMKPAINKGRMSRVEDFNENVYLPSPSEQREYERYLHDIQATIYSLPETESTNLLLLYHMCHAHYHMPITERDLCHIVHCRIRPHKPPEVYETDELITQRISRLYSLLKLVGNISKKNMKSDMRKIALERLDRRMEMIDIDDEKAQMDIAINAVVYLRPETFEKEWIKYEEFKRRFETNKINPKVLRYLEEKSKADGPTWMIEYLRGNLGSP